MADFTDNKKRLETTILGDLIDTKLAKQLEDTTKEYVKTVLTTFGKDYNRQDLKIFMFDLIMNEIADYQIKEGQEFLMNECAKKCHKYEK